MSSVLISPPWHLELPTLNLSMANMISSDGVVYGQKYLTRALSGMEADLCHSVLVACAEEGGEN
jgi:hypothetical protein